MIDLGKQKLEFECESCGKLVKTTFKKAADQATVKCPSCGTNIKLIDSNGSVKKSIRDMKRAFKKLERAFK